MFATFVFLDLPGQCAAYSSLHLVHFSGSFASCCHVLWSSGNLCFVQASMSCSQYWLVVFLPVGLPVYQLINAFAHLPSVFRITCPAMPNCLLRAIYQIGDFVFLKFFSALLCGLLHPICIYGSEFFFLFFDRTSFFLIIDCFSFCCFGGAGCAGCL